jgi:hypothetical protein
MSPQEKAARTRRRRKLEREKAARERSTRARKAALSRWYPHFVSSTGSVTRAIKHVESKAKVKQKKPKQKKLSKQEKKLLVQRKKILELNKKLTKERKKKKQKAERDKIRAKKSAIKRKIEKEIRRRTREKTKEYIKSTTEHAERFGGWQRVPRRHKNETDESYAERIIKQMFGERFYSYEEAAEYYRYISEQTGASANDVFTLFMSPEVA